MPVPPPLRSAPPILVAHRGAHGGGAGPNTPEAVRRAVVRHAPGIEIDVHRLRDGTLVVSHDDMVTVGGVRRPLIDLDAGEAPVPRIEVLVDALAGFTGLLVFDWKGFGCETAIVRLLRGASLFEQTLLTSISPTVLTSLAGTAPGLALGLSFPARAYRDAHDGGDTILALLEQSRAGTAALDRRLPGLAAIAGRVRERGAGLFLWTAPDAATYAELAALAPDGIMSDAARDQLDNTVGSAPPFGPQ